jgi:hypothetical protein
MYGNVRYNLIKGRFINNICDCVLRAHPVGGNIICIRPALVVHFEPTLRDIVCFLLYGFENPVSGHLDHSSTGKTSVAHCVGCIT